MPKDGLILPMLPEGSTVEMKVIPHTETSEPRQVTSLDELRSRLPGEPFDKELESTLRQWRSELWRVGEDAQSGQG